MDTARKIFWEYVKQYRRTALMFIIFSFIFGAVFSLYDLEVEAVIYSAGLCLLLAAAVLTVNFYGYYKKHGERAELLQNIEILSENLPEPKTLIEKDYRAIINKLKKLLNDSVTERSNRQKESIEYYTAWVHQIKTPISVMRMILQGEDTAEHLELSAQLFRIERYVEMVLNYIRLGDDASDFVFKEYYIDGIIKQAVHKYAPQIIRKRIRLNYDQADGITVITDEKWLLFILEQLLSNAVKYTEKGEIAISVTEDKKLTVSDTGIGIAEEDLPRIFEKGFTGYNGRYDKKSTGLGLYLCKLTADKLSHKIEVTSRAGAGTVFSIDLKRYQLQNE
ncbi:MAG: sensor histidine kinase [Firmicutes bacterium]|nr:sensor histidine kinase [[Eubacterium] siraeum]MCM1487629.1 sensor histidine kinase [Bacillota bacterium]